MKRFYITTPIYYVNDKPHIGHAYTTTAADVLARFKRMNGCAVLLATGTDEHGIKVATAAKENNRLPHEHVDLLVEDFKSLWADLGISYDVFIRTTEARHHRATQHIFRKLLDSGDIYKGEYQGWYCLHDETYLSPAEVLDGTCPNPECRRPVTWLSQPSYFFRTSKYAPALRQLLETHPDQIRPETRRNEVLSFLDQGLRDTCISRSHIDWGIPVPADEQNIIYVWFDALMNYLTVAGYPDDDPGFRDIWPPDVQLMAKDILRRFHATLWQAMLMAAGLPLPKLLFAHGFWTAERQKISKSLGNVIDPSALARDLAAASGASPTVCIDAIRYFLLREVPFGLDGDFSNHALIGRFNADLANDLGNLLNRTALLLTRRYSGRIPQATSEDAVCSALAAEVDSSAAAIETLDFSNALVALWRGLAILNRYLDQKSPWSAGRTRKEADKVLYTVFDGLRAISIALLPFMPNAASEILRRLSVPTDPPPTWQDARTFNRLAAGETISSGSPLFPRLLPDAIPATLGNLPAAPAARPLPAAKPAHLSPSSAPQTPQEQQMTNQPEQITLDDFKKLDLRVATVLQAENVPGTDRLIRLLVDIGGATRTLVAGIGDVYRPEDIVNKQLIVVTNLPKTMIRGVGSEGMILAVGDKTVEALLTLDRPAPSGAKVR